MVNSLEKSWRSRSALVIAAVAIIGLSYVIHYLCTKSLIAQIKIYGNDPSINTLITNSISLCTGLIGGFIFLIVCIFRFSNVQPSRQDRVVLRCLGWSYIIAILLFFNLEIIISNLSNIHFNEHTTLKIKSLFKTFEQISLGITFLFPVFYLLLIFSNRYTFIAKTGVTMLFLVSLGYSIFKLFIYIKSNEPNHTLPVIKESTRLIIAIVSVLLACLAWLLIMNGVPNDDEDLATSDEEELPEDIQETETETIMPDNEPIIDNDSEMKEEEEEERPRNLGPKSLNERGIKSASDSEPPTYDSF